MTSPKVVFVVTRVEHFGRLQGYVCHQHVHTGQARYDDKAVTYLVLVT